MNMIRCVMLYTMLFWDGKGYLSEGEDRVKYEQVEWNDKVGYEGQGDGDEEGKQKLLS